MNPFVSIFNFHIRGFSEPFSGGFRGISPYILLPRHHSFQAEASDDGLLSFKNDYSSSRSSALARSSVPVIYDLSSSGAPVQVTPSLFDAVRLWGTDPAAHVFGTVRASLAGLTGGRNVQPDQNT
jgi:hypothetical protein